MTTTTDCESERLHYTTEALATNAARMIALSAGDPEPMLPALCHRGCGDYVITREGTGMPPMSLPKRPPAAERRRRAREDYQRRGEQARVAVEAMVPGSDAEPPEWLAVP